MLITRKRSANLDSNSEILFRYNVCNIKLLKRIQITEMLDLEDIIYSQYSQGQSFYIIHRELLYGQNRIDEIRSSIYYFRRYQVSSDYLYNCTTVTQKPKRKCWTNFQVQTKSLNAFTPGLCQTKPTRLDMHRRSMWYIGAPQQLTRTERAMKQPQAILQLQLSLYHC